MIAQQVVWEALMLLILGEKGAAQHIHQALVTDVVHGKVGKGAGLHIATSIDVKVGTPAGNASVGQFPVIPEVSYW
jgi:hypothetical protein